MPPNFALLDVSWPEVARLIADMVQARDAIEHRSWSPPQEPTSDEWWADVLADPRARKRERHTVAGASGACSRTSRLEFSQDGAMH
jgi:hypothetical protein